MKFLRDFLDKQEPLFLKGAKLEKLYPLFEVVDTLVFTPGQVSKGRTHIRDGIELKRLMTVVIIALFPAVLFGMYNVGLQANGALLKMGIEAHEGWRGALYHMMGFGINPASICGNTMLGALYFFPIYAVTLAAGGIWEVVFSLVRKHEINEGFFVTSMLLPLIVPASIPLWQVALGISFGVIFGKEVFGGTGRNFLNPALVARAFLFFAYPGEISGDLVWVAADGFSGATALSQVAASGIGGLTVTWWDAFWGFMPGSIGETSTFACLIGAAILIFTGIGSWRIMLGIVLSTAVFSLLFNMIGSDTNVMFGMTPLWHFVLGGFAFGTVFMATDPVSAAMTDGGRWMYGALIGLMVVLVRVVNPAFPEGMMLAILFANLFAPLFDFFTVEANIKRRLARHEK